MCASEVGRRRPSAGTARVERGRLGPGPHALRDARASASCATTRSSGGWRRDAPYAEWAGDGFSRLLVRRAPRGATRRPARAASWPTATRRRSWPWCSSPWPTTPTSRRSRWATTRRSPPLAGRPRPIAHYLRQRFAQVTNPPIDSLRERRVMSLRVLLGPRAPLLTEQRRRRPAARASTRSSSSPRRPCSTLRPRDQPVHDRHPVGHVRRSTTGPARPASRGRRDLPTGPRRGGRRRRHRDHRRRCRRGPAARRSRACWPAARCTSA